MILIIEIRLYQNKIKNWKNITRKELEKEKEKKLKEKNDKDKERQKLQEEREREKAKSKQKEKQKNLEKDKKRNIITNYEQAKNEEDNINTQMTTIAPLKQERNDYSRKRKRN